MIPAALLVAVVYTTALAIWTIGRLALGDTAQSTGLIAYGAVLITQCIISAIITPWLACEVKPEKLIALVPLVTTPWPLLLLVVGISGVSTLSVGASQIWVGVLIILSYYSTRGALGFLSEGQLRTITLTVMQLAPAIVLWAGRKTWIPWFTG